jgi:hypothetical protein
MISSNLRNATLAAHGYDAVARSEVADAYC